MCKTDDKDYWQVGDEVYNLTKQQRGCVRNIITKNIYPIETIYNDRELLPDTFTVNGSCNVERNNKQALFHLGAITFDEYGRPIAINYDYVPKRETKVSVTKLPHEFVEGEEVLVKERVSGAWTKRIFVELGSTKKMYGCKNIIEENKLYYWSCCIPLKGNEHCEDKTTNCESGKVPDDYVYPEKEPFSDVKKGDILYRLYEGRYIKGEVIIIVENGFFVSTEEKTTNSANGVQAYDLSYNFKGEAWGEGKQSLFFKKPKQELKPFDKVLVRDKKNDEWTTNMFERKEDKIFRCFLGTWKQCIPYEGNELLLGTNNSPEE